MFVDLRAIIGMCCVIFLLLPAAAAAQAPTRENPAKTAAEQPAKRVLVWQLSSLGVDPEMADNLESFLRNSVSTLPGLTAISRVELDLALAKPHHEALRSCPGGPSCAAKMGRLVQAEVVVFGSIGRMGAAFSMNLVAVNPKTRRVIAKQRSNVSGSRDLLIPGVRLAVFALLAPERIKGALRIEVQLAGVAITVNGKKVGETPIAGVIEGLSPGMHKVELTKSGYAPFTKDVEIRAFETTRLKVELTSG